LTGDKEGVLGEDVKRDLEEEAARPSRRIWLLGSMRSRAMLLGGIYLLGMMVLAGGSAPGVKQILEARETEGQQTGSGMGGAANETPELHVLWEASYEGHAGRCIIPSSQGGYAVCGDKGGEAWVLRIDDAGHKLWDTALGGEARALVGVVETEDGGCVAVGQVLPYEAYADADIFIIRLDRDGGLVWNMTYGTERAGQPMMDQAQGIVPSDDGGFVVAAVVWDSRYGESTYLLKINGDGEKVWENQCGSAGPSCITPTEDGGFLVVAGGLIEVDRDGNEVRARHFERWILPRAVIEAVDGGYLVVGRITNLNTPNRDQNLYAARIDEGWETVWERSYGEPNCTEVMSGAASGIATPDGYVLICDRNLEEGYILGIDQNGTMLWDSTTPAVPKSIVPSPEGGFVTTGCPMFVASFYEGELPLPEPISETFGVLGLVSIVSVLVLAIIVPTAVILSKQR
jgi:hypothetical protein